MKHYDVFNGDADGICALHQLRLARPHASHLVTGRKREIALLAAVPAVAGDQVTVLDVSLDRNRAALMALLERGVHVRYFDHHDAGGIPVHRNLEATIDSSPDTCTSALVDRELAGRHRAWAVVGAFGDNLGSLAARLAQPLALDGERLEALRELGEALNYNAYGEEDGDVLLPAAELYRTVSRYEDPFELMRREQVIERLSEERHADLARARALQPLLVLPHADAWLLPDEPWSRRVSGTFANRLAAEQPARAHAVLTARPAGYVVSVRAPLGRGPSAADLCRRFPSGGGRALAAGIERLPRLEPFLDAFSSAYTPEKEIP
jgi:hypothetical protein